MMDNKLRKIYSHWHEKIINFDLLMRYKPWVHKIFTLL